MGENNFAISNWDDYAKCYDELLALAPYQAMQQRAVSEVLTSRPRNILNAACGTGNFEKAFFATNKQSTNVVGLDFSETMLKMAQKKLLNQTVCFARGDINQALDFSSNSFDAVVSIMTLYAVAQPLETLREFYRVTKQGGEIILITPKKGFQNGLVLKSHCGDNGPDEPWLGAHESEEREWNIICRAIENLELRQKLRALAIFNRQIAKEAKFHFFEEDELVGLFSKVGFNVVLTDYVYGKQEILIKAKKGDWS